MAENDDRLSAPPPGPSWKPADTLSGDLTLTPDELYEKIRKGIPTDPEVTVSSDPPPRLSAGPDGMIPGEALIAALAEVQGTLAQLVAGQTELAEGQRTLTRGLEEVRVVSSKAAKLSAMWVDEANRERTIAETTRDRIEMMERRLTCPQENCPVMRYSNPGPSTLPGTGAPGE